MLSTSLSAQLKNLKQQSLAKKLDISQPPSSLLFTTTIARTVDIDLLYTLAIIGYQNLKLEINCPALAIEILSEEMKGINRNHLTLDENQKLSQKLKKLVLSLSPFLLSQQCQKIIDYMMRNFSIHIFQGEYLALTTIMYFQSPIYRKLISNINIETQHLSFLKPIFKGHQKINPEFIIRAFQHDRYLLNTISKNLLELIVQNRKEETINLGIVEDSFSKTSLLAFVSNIHLGIFNRDPNKYSKDVIKFSFDLLKISIQDQTVQIVLTLLVNVLLKISIQQNFIASLITKLIQKSHHSSNASNLNIFHFVLFCWQKYPNLFGKQLVQLIIQSPLKKHLSRPRSGNCAVYLCLNKSFFEGVDCVEILKQLSLKVKEDKMIIDNIPLQELFYDELFQVFVKSNIKQVDDIQKYQQIIKDSFLFQFAEFVNRSTQPIDTKILYKIFNKKQIESSGKILMNGIISKRIAKQEPLKHKYMDVEQESEQQQDDGNVQPIKEKAPVREVQRILRSMEIQENKEKLIGLVVDYYTSQSPAITASEKNAIIQKLDQNIYTDQYILMDIQRRDWIQPLVQIKTSSNLQVLAPIVNLLVQQQSLLQDIVYKDLLKQVLVRFGVVSKNNYNNVVNIISQFADNLVKNIIQSSNSSIIYSIYEIVLFASQQIIKNNGVVKGKLFRLVFTIIKILTFILNSKLYEDKLTKIFKEALFLFQERNLYIFFIGFASLISKMKFDSTTISKWKKIIIELYFVQNKNGLILLIQAWSRCISFCTSLVEKTEEFKQNPKNVVPKKILVNLFGLIKPKQKAKLARNIIFIIRYFVLSQQLIKGYLRQLKELPEHLRVQLVKQTTDFYSFILTIKTQDSKLQTSLNQLMHDIANLYPLELIIKVITPLLPSAPLYSILLQKLQPHPRFRGKVLDQIIRVKPDIVSPEWLQIVILCLQRGCKIHQQFVQILINEKTSESLALIGEISRHEISPLVPHLQNIMKLLFTIEMDDQYRQAISYLLVQNLKGLLQPYLQDLILSNLCIRSSYSQQLLKCLANNFQAVVLLEIVSKIKPSTSDEHINFCVLLKQLCSLGYGFKLLSIFYNIFQSITDLLDSQDSDLKELFDIQSLQAQTFEIMCLKLNESQLNKVLNNLAVWSEKNSPKTNLSSFGFRKLITLKIFLRLSETMKDLFLNFHKYLYDSLVIDLNNILSDFQKSNNKKNVKRQLSVSARGIQLTQTFVSETLLYFKSIFDNDTQQSFIDTLRFQKLSKTISEMFTLNLTGIPQQHTSFITTQLTPTVISLCNMVNDDYKLKTLNANILQNLSLSNNLVNHGIFLYLNQEMVVLGERNLVLFNDLLPYLAEYRQSRDKSVQNLCRKLISQIEQMSGEKIDGYFQK